MSLALDGDHRAAERGVEPERRAPPISATTIENDFYKITVDPADGSLTSLLDKVRGKEMIDTASTYDFNELASSTKAQMDGGQAPAATPPSGESPSVSGKLPVHTTCRRASRLSERACARPATASRARQAGRAVTSIATAGAAATVR